MCRTCEKECGDVQEHLMTVHKFSKTTIESQLETNPDSYKHHFKKLK